MKIIGIVPARGGSKGIPQKNIRKLCGRPLIAYTIEAAAAAKFLDHFVVSTDCEKIASVAAEYGAQVVHRPSELAADDSPTLDTLKHVLGQMNQNYDAIMTLQPTSPLRTSAHIDEAILEFQASPEADSLVSVVKIPHNFSPNSVMRMTEDSYLVDYIEQSEWKTRRQDKEVCFARNGAAIYLTKRHLIETSILGGKIKPYLMSSLDSVDIDDEFDWHLAALLLRDRESINLPGMKLNDENA